MRSRVAVVGGGLVGAAAALSLNQLGFPVTVIERSAPAPRAGRLGLDIRNVALNVASMRLLESLGVWSALRPAPYAHMRVWEQWGSGRVTFDAADVGRTELGWLVEMSPLACALWQASTQAGVECVLDELAGVALDPQQVVLNLKTTGERTFDFLIAADGAHSVVRRALGLGVSDRPVDQVALATVVRTRHPHQDTAWQRFLTDGPLALLPSPDPHLSSVVWSQSRAQAERRLNLADGAFRSELTHASEACLGDIDAVDERFSFPLSQQMLSTPLVADRVLFVGDSARVVHPLAGFGVNLGFEDVCALSGVARGADDLVRAPGWPGYARGRTTRSRAMIALLGAFNTLYGSTRPEVTWLRNLGVRTFNAMGGLKKQVMREAMGLGPVARGGLGTSNYE